MMVHTLYYIKVRCTCYRLQEGQTVDEALYQELFYEVVGKRVKKRALALLEKMDRTEQGLYRKLAESEYPEELILDAIEYVKKYHYIDDMRYARNYISYRQGSKSRRRLQQELMPEGSSQRNYRAGLRRNL